MFSRSYALRCVVAFVSDVLLGLIRQSRSQSRTMKAVRIKKLNTTTCPLYAAFCWTRKHEDSFKMRRPYLISRALTAFASHTHTHMTCSAFCLHEGVCRCLRTRECRSLPPPVVQERVDLAGIFRSFSTAVFWKLCLEALCRRVAAPASSRNLSSSGSRPPKIRS